MPLRYKDITSNEILIWKHLQKIMRNLTKTTEEKFTKKLDLWYEMNIHTGFSEVKYIVK